MALLNKDQILAAKDEEYVEIAVPEWGGEVRLRGLTGSERDRFEASLAKMKGDQMVPDMVNARARLVAMSAVDEKGHRMFSDTEIVKLGAKSSKALDRLFEAASKLSGISPQEMEDIAKDFSDAQSENSTSD